MLKTAQQRKNKSVFLSIAAQLPLSSHSNENPYNWRRRKDMGDGVGPSARREGWGRRGRLAAHCVKCTLE